MFWLDWDAFGSLGRKTQAYTLLSLPMVTMINLAQSHPSQHGKYLRAMPPLFFAKLCCLSCELLSNLPPSSDSAQQVAAISPIRDAWNAVIAQSTAFAARPVPGAVSDHNHGVPVTAAAARTAAARDLEINLPGSHPATRLLFTSSYDLFFFYLVSSMANLMREKVMTRNKNASLDMFLHPAVILVFKSSLTLRTGVKDKTDLVQFCERTTLTILTRLVSIAINSAVQQGSQRPRLEAAASVRPRVVVSDDSLLRTLCRRLCMDVSLVDDRYDLMMSIVNCWPAAAASRLRDLPFPVPDGGEQICGIVTLAHHFSVEVVRWMREEKLERQRWDRTGCAASGCRHQQEAAAAAKHKVSVWESLHHALHLPSDGCSSRGREW